MKGRSQGQERATWGPLEHPGGERQGRQGQLWPQLEEVMSGEGDGWRKEGD